MISHRGRGAFLFLISLERVLLIQELMALLDDNTLEALVDTLSGKVVQRSIYVENGLVGLDIVDAGGLTVELDKLAVCADLRSYVSIIVLMVNKQTEDLNLVADLHKEVISEAFAIEALTAEHRKLLGL